MLMRLWNDLRATIKMCWQVQEFSWVGHGVVTLLALAAGIVFGAVWGATAATLCAAYYHFREWLDIRKHKRKGDYRAPQAPGEATSRGDGVGDRTAPTAIALTAWAFVGPSWLGAIVAVASAGGLLALIWNTDRAKDWRAQQRGIDALRDKKVPLP